MFPSVLWQIGSVKLCQPVTVLDSDLVDSLLSIIDILVCNPHLQMPLWSSQQHLPFFNIDLCQTPHMEKEMIKATFSVRCMTFFYFS